MLSLIFGIIVLIISIVLDKMASSLKEKVISIILGFAGFTMAFYGVLANVFQ